MYSIVSVMISSSGITSAVTGVNVFARCSIATECLVSLLPISECHSPRCHASPFHSPCPFFAIVSALAYVNPYTPNSANTPATVLARKLYRKKEVA